MTPNTLFGISRTTLNGWLMPLTVGLGIISTTLLPSTLQSPSTSHWWAWVVFAATLGSGILHGINGQGQADGKTANQIGQIALLSVASGAPPPPVPPLAPITLTPNITPAVEIPPQTVTTKETP